MIPDRIEKTTTAGYFTAFIGLGMVSAVLGPTLPGLAENTQVTLSEISILFVARALGYLLGVLAAGHVYDRRRGHPIMAVTLIIVAAAAVAVPIIPKLWLLSALLIPMGMAAGMLDVGGNTLVVWHKRKNVAPYMNALHFFFGLGAFLAPILVAQAVLHFEEMTWAYWFIAPLLLPVAVLLFRLPSPAPETASHERPETPVRWSLVGLIAVFFLLYAGTEISVGGWIFTYAVEQNLTAEAGAAYLTAAFWGMFTVGRLLAVPLATRLKPQTLVLINFAGSFVGVGVLLFGMDSLTLTWAGTMVLGLSLASTFPNTLSLAGHHLTITGRITSWFFVGATLGGMAMPWLIGQLIGSIGPAVVLYTFLTALILSLALFLTLLFILRKTIDA